MGRAMKAIEVKIDGKRVCLAGTHPNSYVVAEIHLDNRDGEAQATLTVCGQRGSNIAVWTEWIEFPIDSEVTVRVVETENDDTPADLHPLEPAPDQPCHSK
jgi:hypothetical protein